MLSIDAELARCQCKGVRIPYFGYFKVKSFFTDKPVLHLQEPVGDGDKGFGNSNSTPHTPGGNQPDPAAIMRELLFALKHFEGVS